MAIWTGSQSPNLGERVFIARGASVIGDVRLGNDSSVFYGSVLRGDINYISLGDRSNIQDLCCCHVADDHPCIIGKDVVVGHHVVLHGCTIEDAVLVGIGAIILNGAHIGYGSIIGAGALVTQGTKIPPYSLVLGSPGKVVKTLDQSSVETTLAMAKKYIWVKDNHLKHFK